jgi:hypothetical protein
MSRQAPQPLVEVYVTSIQNGKNGGILQKGLNSPVVVVKKPAPPSPAPPPKTKP